MIDLHDLERLAAHKARQTDPVGAGALDPERFDRTKRTCPRNELGVAGPVGRDTDRRESGSEEVDRDSDVDEFVSVDSDDHLGSWFIWRDAV